MPVTRLWFGENLSEGGMFLMPISFLSNVGSAEAVGMSSEEQHVMDFLAAQRKEPGVATDKQFDVALTIEVTLKRTKAEGARFNMSTAPDAIPMGFEESDIRDTHPSSYDTVTRRLALRFTDFKINTKYHELPRVLETDARFCRGQFLTRATRKVRKRTSIAP